jgi:hypothetical protein
MYYLFKRTTEKTEAIEQYQHAEQALARMEYLGMKSMDANATGFFVESGDKRIFAEWEV